MSKKTKYELDKLSVTGTYKKKESNWGFWIFVGFIVLVIASA